MFFKAEKALATLHLRPIPNLEPPVILKFCVTANLKAFEAPDPTVFPRVIPALPAGCNEVTLYDALRPYGPLYSVRFDPIAGGLVQFWTEDNAQDAEISGPTKPGRQIHVKPGTCTRKDGTLDETRHMPRMCRACAQTRHMW
ncbi:hypothetical protein B0H17DRAFT_1199042 [Mycena rosella]|uniref:Uncharacterized protein n=1 Tax=Mycena rosella TaxID=1033263 RepID=A0AAD7DM44_MYCRO|nr:hypothetical protein B0H17DRAFT_1199042 [Mycena rosella]